MNAGATTSLCLTSPPGYLVASLRDRELLYRNSASYHELYFGNLGGNGADLGGVKDLVAGANHTQAMASSVPLLVMDMYEHAYAMDFGAGAAKYIEAFFRNIDWSVVMKRWAAARSAHAALTSSR